MILAVDIGNSNTVFGAYKQDKLLFCARVQTDSLKTETEYAVLIQSILALHKADAAALQGAIISSVVPPLSPVMKDAICLVKQIPVLAVGPGLKTGLDIKIDSPRQLGADLVCTAVGALEKYPLPVIIIDMGTATKLTVVDRNRAFIGGAIMPGVMIALDALAEKAAQLPPVSLQASHIKAIGANTVDCMQAGAVLGAASMIDGMVQRYREEIGQDATVVACGGVVEFILPHCKQPIIQDRNLLLDGLKALYDKNIG